MKFRIYNEGGDTELFFVDDKKKLKNEFVFTGFSNGLHPYFKRQQDFLCEALASGGINLNVKTVPTVDDMGESDGYFKPKDVLLPTTAKSSKDGKFYHLVQDEEMGRGWAVLLMADGKGKKMIIHQDHRDNVRDWLMNGDWIRKFGIDFKVENVGSFDKIAQ